MLRTRGPLCLLIAPLAIGVLAACGPDRKTHTDPDATPDVSEDILPDTDISPDVDPDVPPDVDVGVDIFEDIDVAPDPDAEVGPDADPPACGDGILDPDERCDDGNVTPGDGCSNNCAVEYCGDGFVSTGLGEECDSGADFTQTCRDLDLGDGALGCLVDTCRFDVRDCERGRCGDGVVSGDEGCDDGNVLDGDGCSSICFVETCLATNADCGRIAETCDGLDNDGDGFVDDHPTDDALGTPCDAGCGGGTWVCRGGAIVCDGPEPVEPALCNGRDDECAGVDDGCAASVVAGGTLDRDVVLASPDLDVLLLVDGSPSMAEARAELAAQLADGWWPDGAARIAVASAGDVPVAPFGAPTDRPWTLHRRAASLVADADGLAEAFAAAAVSRAGDPGLAAWPVLVHAAVGDGFAWPGRPRVPAPEPGTLFELTGTQTPSFEVDVRAGQRVDIEVISARAGEPLDAILEVLAPGSNTPFARNDDRYATDPALTVIAPADGLMRIRVVGCCGDDPTARTEGWAGLYVRVDGAPFVVGRPWGSCAVADLEDADDPTRNDLVDARDVWPRPARVCARDCRTAGAPDALVRDFCGDGLPLGRCGNGRVDSGETCDDGDFVVGDGCGADCQLEADRVAPFAATDGYVPALGHGDRGGFGFTAGARPVIAWVTDSPAHDTDVWDAIEADLPGAAEAAATLADLGVVPVVVDPSDDAPARDAFAAWARLAGGVTDPCGWGEARTCPADRCCDGSPTGAEPVDGVCALAVGGSDAPLAAHIDAGLRAAANAPLDLDLVIESDVAGAACLVDEIRVVADPACGPAPRVDLDAGRLAGARAGQRITFQVVTSNRDTRDMDGDADRTEPCLRPVDVPVRIIASDHAGAVYFDEPFVIEVD